MKLRVVCDANDPYPLLRAIAQNTIVAMIAFVGLFQLGRAWDADFIYYLAVVVLFVVAAAASPLAFVLDGYLEEIGRTGFYTVTGEQITFDITLIGWILAFTPNPPDDR